MAHELTIADFIQNRERRVRFIPVQDGPQKRIGAARTARHLPPGPLFPTPATAAVS